MRLVGARFTRHVLLPVQEFIRTESAGGIVLLAATLVALAWANSPWDSLYHDLWDTVITVDGGIFHISEELRHWVNDALMAVFFFVVGLEIKREVLHGTLAGPRRAALPAAAALGGMAVPALLFTLVNAGGPGGKGWGIPMATDIAFSLGALALLGRRIPTSVRIFLLATAVVDDIGAIAVIAIFYSGSIAWDSLALAGLLVVGIVALQQIGVRVTGVYVIIGAALWVAVFESGIHATIAGVALGLLTPSRPLMPRRELSQAASKLAEEVREAARTADDEEAEALLTNVEEVTTSAEAPLERWERILHPWASFVVVPVFALANAGIEISGSSIGNATGSPVTLGVMLGLLVGKPIGIVGATLLAAALRLGRLPAGITIRHLIGLGVLAGIGFTVSIFISGLAYKEPELANEAKMGILAASALASAAGYMFLRVATPAGAR